MYVLIQLLYLCKSKKVEVIKCTECYQSAIIECFTLLRTITQVISCIYISLCTKCTLNSGRKVNVKGSFELLFLATQHCRAKSVSKKSSEKKILVKYTVETYINKLFILHYLCVCLCDCGKCFHAFFFTFTVCGDSHTEGHGGRLSELHLSSAG